LGFDSKASFLTGFGLIKIFEHLPGFKTYLAQKPEEIKNIILESYRGNNPCYIRL
jgi:hypothetical protein